MIHLKLGELILKEAAKCNNESEIAICEEEGLSQLMKGHASDDLKAEEKEVIKVRIKEIIEGCSCKLQKKINVNFFTPNQSPNQPVTKGPRQKNPPPPFDLQKLKFTATEKVTWDDIVLNPCLKVKKVTNECKVYS